ncbi:MAG: amidase [bacterium]
MPELYRIEDLLTAYSNKSISPFEVAETLLKRIEAVDPILNTYITIARDEALAEAEVATAAWKRGRKLPLLGVPVNVKDIFLTAGMRTTCGSRILKNHVPDRDATVVQRLRKAGAILLGKANMLEFAYGAIHEDYGPTHNPWNVRHSTGGSSSGSAASVAAGLAYGSIGTDTGGSIRQPASYCGLVGIKPTYELVSREGCYPLSWTLDHVGPMARTVRDAALLLDVIAGDGADTLEDGSGRSKPGRYLSCIDDEVRGLRIGVWSDTWETDLLAPGVRSATSDALVALREAGATVSDVSISDTDFTGDLFTGILFPEASSIHLDWLRTRAEEYAPQTRLRLQIGAALPATLYIDALRLRNRYRGALDTVLRRVEALVLPTMLTTAPREGEIADLLTRTRFTAPFNITGHPSVSVPCGLVGGLPVGLQIVARYFDESCALRVARTIERALPVTCPVSTSYQQ